MADPTATINDERITCQIDGAKCHSIQIHIREHHPEWTIERYQQEFPDAPLLSERAKRVIESKRKEKDAAKVTNAPARRKGFFHDIFDLGPAPAARNAAGNPIEVTLVDSHSELMMPYIADVDQGYVFNIDLTKKVLVGMELNMPVYLWGFHGTGKTTIFEQVAARTRRPFMRVQHTINTEESHILGQYVVRSKPVEVEEIDATGKKHTVIKQMTVTEYELGPLPLAMLEGAIYCADEYDIAMPSVVAVYQAVLEGKPLIIKDAPSEYRVIRPHPDFRFVATGNTSGIGDESGLYQGTLVQNAANYSRFPITEEVEYMDPKIEENVVISKSGVPKEIANKLVKIAKEVRQNFADGKISMTVSPRELIHAAILGMAFGGNWQLGLKLAFANRLSRIDRKVVEEFAQRVFGS